jgi:hypothetical protein
VCHPNNTCHKRHKRDVIVNRSKSAAVQQPDSDSEDSDESPILHKEYYYCEDSHMESDVYLYTVNNDDSVKDHNNMVYLMKTSARLQLRRTAKTSMRLQMKRMLKTNMRLRLRTHMSPLKVIPDSTPLFFGRGEEG